MIQITYRLNGTIDTREITTERFAEYLLDLYFLKDAGENIKITPDANFEFGRNWSVLLVERKTKRGTVKTVFKR